MSFKLNADAAEFIPSSNTGNNNNLTAKHLWRQIQCLNESISDLNVKITETNISIQSKQSQLKSLFQLFHQYDTNTLTSISLLRQNLTSLNLLHNNLSINCGKMIDTLKSNYSNYIHKYSPLPILFDTPHKIPSNQHDLFICGYCRSNCINKIAMDLINIIKSFVTIINENSFIWHVKHNNNNTITSNSFYCDDIEFKLLLNLNKMNLTARLNVISFGCNVKTILISYQLYVENSAIMLQNTQTFDFNSEQLIPWRCNKYHKGLDELTIGCKVRILRIGYANGSVKNRYVNMQRNFLYHWCISDLLRMEIGDASSYNAWSSNTQGFDNNNWCLWVRKFGEHFQLGLELLKLPYNVSKIGVKYGINYKEYYIEYFSYDKPVHMWKTKYEIPSIEDFRVVVSVQIMSVFDTNDKYVTDWSKFGISS